MAAPTGSSLLVQSTQHASNATPIAHAVNRLSPVLTIKQKPSAAVTSVLADKSSLSTKLTNRAAPKGDLQRLDRARFQAVASEAVSQPESKLNFCTLPALGVQGAFLNPTGKSADEAFQVFQRRVTEFNTPGLMNAVAAFEKISVSETTDRLPSSNKPRVGILFSEWFQLTEPGLKQVIALVKSHGCEPLLIFPMADALFFEDANQAASGVLEKGAQAVHRETHEKQAARLQAISQFGQQLDGLIALGGPDIDPNIYGQKNEDSVFVNKPRDRFDSSLLLDVVLQQRLYLFAICRSHQMLNATLGGKLVQDMRKAGYSAQSRNQRDYNVPADTPFQLKDEAGKVLFSHDVDVDENSDAGRIAQTSPLLTNSFHHQVVVQPGKSLKVVGTIFDAEVDKRTIEMTESWQATTTQFHPERLLHTDVFEKITATACRRARIFHGQKQGAWGNVNTLLKWMHDYQGAKPFVDADFEWVAQNYDRLSKR